MLRAPAPSSTISRPAAGHRRRSAPAPRPAILPTRWLRSCWLSMGCRSRVALRYVDGDGRPAELYPANPNGSPDGIAGLTKTVALEVATHKITCTIGTMAGNTTATIVITVLIFVVVPIVMPLVPVRVKALSSSTTSAGSSAKAATTKTTNTSANWPTSEEPPKVVFQTWI